MYWTAKAYLPWLKQKLFIYVHYNIIWEEIGVCVFYISNTANGFYCFIFLQLIKLILNLSVHELKLLPIFMPLVLFPQSNYKLFKFHTFEFGISGLFRVLSRHVNYSFYFENVNKLLKEFFLINASLHKLTARVKNNWIIFRCYFVNKFLSDLCLEFLAMNNKQHCGHLSSLSSPK